MTDRESEHRLLDTSGCSSGKQPQNSTSNYMSTTSNSENQQGMEHSDQVHSDNSTESKCGWSLCCQPCLSPCKKRIIVTIFICFFSFALGFVVHGITPVISETLERRFSLSSQQIGWYNSIVDISALVTSALVWCVVIPNHRPRWLMVAAIFLTLGCTINCIPHFTAEPYNGNFIEQGRQCHATENSKSLDCSNGRPFPTWFTILLIGNFVTGIGCGIFIAVALVFLNDVAEITRAMMLFGKVFFSCMLGSSTGFSVGSQILKIDLNIDRPEWFHFQGDPSVNPKYCGAWWMGYAIGAIVFALLALFLSCFGRVQPEEKSSDFNNIETQTTTRTSQSSESLAVQRKETSLTLAISMLNLLGIPSFNLLSLSFITHELFIEGTKPFFIKLLKTQFELNEEHAAIAAGVLIVTSCFIALAFGGILLKVQIGSSVSSGLIITACVGIMKVILAHGFLLHGPQTGITGITVNSTFDSYKPIPHFGNGSNLFDACNANCNCSVNNYLPVCNEKTGVQYYSPCFAGCQREKSIMRNNVNVTIFSQCSCLSDQNDELVSGSCHKAEDSWSYFYLAMAIIFLILFTNFIVFFFHINIVMQQASENSKGTFVFALFFLSRFTASITGPLMFGSMFDRLCIFSDKLSCQNSACQAYDTVELSMFLVRIFIILQCILALCQGFHLICGILVEKCSKCPSNCITPDVDSTDSSVKNTAEEPEIDK